MIMVMMKKTGMDYLARITIFCRIVRNAAPQRRERDTLGKTE